MEVIWLTKRVSVSLNLPTLLDLVRHDGDQKAAEGASAQLIQAQRLRTQLHIINN